MNTRERIRRILNFQPVDRQPVIEWGPWWDKTLARWQTEGLDPRLPNLRWTQPGKPLTAAAGEVGDLLGLDPFRVVWLSACRPNCPVAAADHGGLIQTREDYLRLKPFLYPDPAYDPAILHGIAEAQQRDGLALWMWIDGFFWFPRILFGIEPHLYAFYDQPELMAEINADLLAWYERTLPALFKICTPDIFLVAEDLSYNHGPMLSKNSFDQLLAPYYRPLVKLAKEHGICPMMDSDGDVMPIIPWLYEVGIEGLAPLERMAGVDVPAIRRHYPDFRMIGGFDKIVMSRGDVAVRQEFERLRDTVASGGYIMTTDHQTPPEVSLEQYRRFRQLFSEYTTVTTEA
jgi:hypothetical protein